MPVIIQNARVHGYRDLVRITCDPDNGHIVSIQPEPAVNSGSTALLSPTISREPNVFGSRVRIHRHGSIVNDLIDAQGSLVLPGLVHAHVHLDKPYLLDRCTIDDGTFTEAMKKTQVAKTAFEEDDLLSRGRRLIKSSISHGVTTMRAHVEVDPTVDFVCLEAGLQLKAEFATSCDVRLVVFAQDSIFTGPSGSEEAGYTKEMRSLLESAIQKGAISAIGSAPYVEKGGKKYEMANIGYILDLAEKYGIDADFHLDFDLSKDSRLMDLLEEIRKRPLFHSSGSRPARRNSTYPLRVTIGHCRTLSRASVSNLNSIAHMSKGLEVYIVGLPNSDMYMHHTGEDPHYYYTPRGLLNALELEKQDGLQGHVSLAVNNVGNLFTPQGDGDPLSLLPLAVAVYQNATEKALQALVRMVSVQAAKAAGMRPAEHAADLCLKPGEPADLVILDGCIDCRTAALAPSFARVTLKKGRVVSRRTVESWIHGDAR